MSKKYGVWISGYRGATRVGRLAIVFNSHEDYLWHLQSDLACIKYLYTPAAEYVVVDDFFDASNHPPSRSIFIPPNY